LHDIKIEIGVTVAETVDFRRVTVANRAIMPVKNQNGPGFSARIQGMTHGSRQVSERGAGILGAADRERATKQNCRKNSHDPFLIFKAHSWNLKVRP
jgi:hypothetical protein